MSAPAPGMSLECRRVVELVTDYLEDRLTPVLRSELDAHLARCRGCATYLAQMVSTLRQLGRVRDATLGADARAELVAAFVDLHPAPGRWSPG